MPNYEIIWNKIERGNFERVVDTDFPIMYYGYDHLPPDVYNKNEVVMFFATKTNKVYAISSDINSLTEEKTMVFHEGTFDESEIVEAGS